MDGRGRRREGGRVPLGGRKLDTKERIRDSDGINSISTVRRET